MNSVLPLCLFFYAVLVACFQKNIPNVIVIRHDQKRKQGTTLDHLRKRLGAVLLEGVDKGLIRRQGAECTAHVGVDDLQAVDVAGVDPAETVFTRALVNNVYFILKMQTIMSTLE